MKFLRDRALPEQELQDRASKAFGQQTLGDRGKRHEPPLRPERPVGRKHIDVRIEVRQVPEGLHEQNQARPGPGQRLGVSIGEQPRRDAAKLAEPGAVHSEHRPQQPREREHVLAVRNGFEDLLLDPLAVEQYPLLVAARAEVALLAGPGEQPVVPAGVAVDPRESVMPVAALEKSLERARLHRAAQPSRLPQLRPVALGALPQRARARVAWPVHAHARRGPVAIRASPLAHARANARRVTALTQLPQFEGVNLDRSRT